MGDSGHRYRGPLVSQTLPIAEDQGWGEGDSPLLLLGALPFIMQLRIPVSISAATSPSQCIPKGWSSAPCIVAQTSPFLLCFGSESSTFTCLVMCKWKTCGG